MSINPLEFLKNIKNLQSSLGSMQDDLKNLVVTGTAGGDMVKVEMNGSFDLLSIKIDKSVVDPEDVEMLQDLIRAAYSNGVVKLREKMKEQISPLASQMNIPPEFMGK